MIGKTNKMANLDNNTCGVVYIAAGARHIQMALKSAQSVRDTNPILPIHLYADWQRQNFEFDYEFNSKINEKNDRIDIYYTNAISVKKELKNVIEFKKNKPIHKLDSGMTLSTNDKESLSIDLQKEILYIPKDTIFSGELKIIGNVFESKKTPDALIITAMRNIYLYINKKILNLSFDQQTWGLSTILSVKFSRYLLVKSKDKNRIHFCLNVELSFKE